MKYLAVSVLLVLALTAISLAQITFTREWVTGKRSSPYPKVNFVLRQDADTSCKRKTLSPAINYLMEIEKEHAKACEAIRKVAVGVENPNPDAEDLQSRNVVLRKSFYEDAVANKAT